MSPQQASAAPPPAPVPSPRNTGLDRARAVAVIAMVMGHTLDAVLTDEARDGTGMLAYWSMRAVTAPLFLFVAGWAFATTVQRTGAWGPGVLRRYVPRVGLLLGWGYLLRWPGWGLPALFAGDVEVWRHFLAFDALHGVAGALLMGASVLALLKARVARMGALALLAVLFPLVSPGLRASVEAGGWPLVLELVLVGRASNFPLFPWAAYFFVGGLTGLGLAGVKRVPHWLCLMGPGTGLLAVMALWGGDPRSSDLALVVWRVGLLAVVAGLAMLLPSRLDGLLGPVGRASLWVYVVHLPLAYGWSTFAGLAGRLGRSQEVLPALGLALSVLALSLLIALPAKKRYSRWRARERGAGASASAALVSEPPVSG
ncbi:heparan-alpha-glucosaminide N-acetyltransferase domain-containing protein [Vitiosangium sp. GDMCC 1.1324]|uniref:heparan-alpha-glucosaminide N-acetyltransferase domain-containing protein n=1 Tax=Vitiosangium sp. (strain GDMCC 1.1324) TaxID=2138576 RepID=UPI000D346886|nr:heparan-alpha-glucosaminide N-acetyltransferase domain-containing protein [Vitiosangium sp. GDMCC 1.1324]PTL84809.1 acyltransferase [Vitiosangium sp. GDMCC 1.1324]